jgi:H+/gluconate symporter-like permease
MTVHPAVATRASSSKTLLIGVIIAIIVVIAVVALVVTLRGRGKQVEETV